MVSAELEEKQIQLIDFIDQSTLLLPEDKVELLRMIPSLNSGQIDTIASLLNEEQSMIDKVEEVYRSRRVAVYQEQADRFRSLKSKNKKNILVKEEDSSREEDSKIIQNLFKN